MINTPNRYLIYTPYDITRFILFYIHLKYHKGFHIKNVIYKGFYLIFTLLNKDTLTSTLSINMNTFDLISFDRRDRLLMWHRERIATMYRNVYSNMYCIWFIY